MRFFTVLVAAALLSANKGARPDVDDNGEVEASIVGDAAVELSGDGKLRPIRSSLAQGKGPLFDVPASKVVAALAQGLTAISEGVSEFIKEQRRPDHEQTADASDGAAAASPGYIREGLSKIGNGLWEMDKLLVPSKYHISIALGAVESDHAEVFLDMPNITTDINRFRQFGDTAGLAEALLAIISKAITKAPAPKLPAYLEALNKIVTGMGQGWQMQGDGAMDMAIQSVWQGFAAALEAVNEPADIDLSYHISKLDLSFSQLNTKVLAEKRRIVASKVCYKRDRVPFRVLPKICTAGWVSDNSSSCIPAPTAEVDCMESCGNLTGMCSSYCGEGKACCNSDAGNEDAIECQNVTGFQAAGDTHQCVDPGAPFAFFIKDAGEAMLRGYWFEAKDEVNSRPAYQHKTHSETLANMAWSNRWDRWEIFTTELALTARHILYSSGMNSTTFPINAWQGVESVHPPEIVPKANNSFQMDDADLRQPPSVRTAACQGDYIRKGLWCVAPCTGNFTQKVDTCQQTCAEPHPADGEEGICGTSPEEMQFATLSMEKMAANIRLFNRDDLTTNLQESNVNVSALSATMDSFFDQSEHFQHPLCPEPEADKEVAR